MSKILLSAFGGNLQGEYNLPENWDGRDLWLLMDMEVLSPSSFGLGKAVYDEPTTKRARFQQTPGGVLYKGGAIEKWILVEVV